MRLLNIGYGIRTRLNDIFGRFSVTSKEIVDNTYTEKTVKSIQEMNRENMDELASAVSGSYIVPGGKVWHTTMLTGVLNITPLIKCGFDANPEATRLTPQPFTGVTQYGQRVVCGLTGVITVALSTTVNNHMFWRVEYEAGSDVRSFNDGTERSVEIGPLGTSDQLTIVQNAATPTELASEPTWLYLGYIYLDTGVWIHAIPPANTFYV